MERRKIWTKQNWIKKCKLFPDGNDQPKKTKTKKNGSNRVFWSVHFWIQFWSRFNIERIWNQYHGQLNWEVREQCFNRQVDRLPGGATSYYYKISIHTKSFADKNSKKINFFFSIIWMSKMLPNIKHHSSLASNKPQIIQFNLPKGPRHGIFCILARFFFIFHIVQYWDLKVIFRNFIL